MSTGDNIVLCPNLLRDTDMHLTLAARKLLEDAGYRAVISPMFPPEDVDLGGIPTVPMEKAVENAALMVCFGGDGTILHTARVAMRRRVPILGINMGNKGFMAELEPEELDKLLDAAAGRYTPSIRMMLDVELIRNGEVIYRDHALNDAVISGVVHAIHLTAYGDGETITEFSGDGAIVCTPTGSTAYSMSAGGPLVEPTAENLILTPICAHVLAARSFVLAPEREVRVMVDELADKTVVLSVDGGKSYMLKDGDVLRVVKSDYVTLLAHVGNRSFYDIAYKKLGDRR